MSRRSLLRRILLAAAAPALGALTLTESAPIPVDGDHFDTWRWVELPGTGLEAFVAARKGLASTPISWAADGTVTAPELGLTITAHHDHVTTMSAAGSGLTVRRIIR